MRIQAPVDADPGISTMDSRVVDADPGTSIDGLEGAWLCTSAAEMRIQRCEIRKRMVEGQTHAHIDKNPRPYDSAPAMPESESKIAR